MKTKKMVYMISSIIIGVVASYSCNHDKAGVKIPKPVFNSIFSSDSVVKQYELYEINVELTAIFDNAFDPSQIQLTATFVSPGGKTELVDGFFFQDFTRDYAYEREMLKEKGNPTWKIRFTPTEKGVYTYYLTIKNYTKNNSSSTYSFACIESENKGFIKKSETNNIFLEFDNKTSYIPVGMSIAWVNQKNGTYDYDYYFKKLNDNKCNYSRIWLVEWNLPLEWTDTKETKGIVNGLGKYSLDNSWRIDYIIEQARKNDLYLLITLGTYGEVMREAGDWNEGIWKNNPYNKQNGGMCSTPADFWTNPEAIKYYKNKLRYIISRWGYSPNILAFELWNEVDAPVDWIIEQSSYIKQKDIYKHMITTSVGYPFEYPNTELVDNTWKIDNIDFVQTHLYGNGGDIINIDQAINNISTKNVEKYKKPHFVAEFGIDFYKDDMAYDKKGTGTQLHNAMWSSLMSLSMGAAITHWKEYVDKMDLYKEFSYFSNFIQRIDFKKGNWNKIQTIENYSNATDSTIYKFQAVTEWGDNPVGAIFLEPKQPNQNINKFIHSKRYSDKAHYYTPQFKVDMQAVGNFIIHVNEVAENARLVAYIDNQRAWEHYFYSADHSLKKSYRNEKYNINMLVFDNEYGFPISAGNHEIRIENEGTDWLSVKNYSIVFYKENYTVTGISNNNEILGWINNKNHNWKYMNSTNNLPMVKDISFKIINVPKNTYRVDWFDPQTGVFTDTEMIVSENGLLKLILPNLLKDKAFIIKPLL